MNYVLLLSVFLLFGCLPAVATESNNDIVLEPQSGKTGAEKLMVFIPGANVPTENYETTVKAIQAASDLQLWVAIPSFPLKRCIIFCPTTSLCGPLQSYVTSIYEKAAAQGFNGSQWAPDTFITGHSLGGICAQRLAISYTDPPYQAAVVLGSYTEAISGAGSEFDFPVPILTVGAELDGGLGRPAMIGVRLNGSDAAAAATTATNATAWQLEQVPVLILQGLDHSSFCPGFQVPGDVFPAEASEEQAMALVGETVAAFLALHTQSQAEKQEAARDLLAAKMAWTRLLLAPLKAAYAWEAGTNSGNDTYAPLCVKAQEMLAGDEASSLVDIESAMYKTDSHDFEHTRTTYRVEAGGRIALNVSGHNDYYSGISTGCLVPAEDIGCKMTSADQIAKQLGLNATSSPQCRDVNEFVVSLAEEILSKTPVGAATLARFKAKGRGIMFADDFSPFGNIGPLFVKGAIKIEDSAAGITVSSIAILNALDSVIFPGVHYCKLLSPARVIDYIMIDALKDASGCLNA